MINRNATIKWKGYDPDDLKSQSSKRVWANCDDCGNGRWSVYAGCTDLCRSCAAKRRPPVSEATREKLSKLNTGRKMSDTARKNNAKARRGKKLLLETRSKIRQSLLGRKKSDITRKRLSDALRGRKLSPYQVAQMSKSMVGVFAGEKHWNWKGGISSDPYCVKFNEEIKTAIRDQYDNCDYISGLHKDVYNGGLNLDVHHIDYNKMQGCDDHDWSLIPLSHGNHTKTNFNRSFWNLLFIYALEYDKAYYKEDTVKDLKDWSADAQKRSRRNLLNSMRTNYVR